MQTPRVVITAGLSRSIPAELLAELVRRDGADIAGVLIVSVFSVSRLRALVRQRGLSSVIRRIRMAARPRSAPPESTAHTDPLAEFAATHRIVPAGLRAWCRKHGIPVRVVRDLNGVDAVAFVAATSPDIVVYAGGGILRAPFLSAAKRVINAHAGPLPEIRGMNAAEWAALLGERPEVTIHFIDTGIDTGPIIRAFTFDRQACRTVNDLRAAAVVRGVEGLRQVIAERLFATSAMPAPGPVPGFRQCFTMAPVLIDKLEAILAAHRPETAA